MLYQLHQNSFHQCNEVEAWVSLHAGGANFDVSPGAATFEYRVNAAMMTNVALLFTSCSAATDVSYGPVSYLRRIFQIRNVARFTVDGRAIEDVGVGVSDSKRHVLTQKTTRTFTILVCALTLLHLKQNFEP